MLGTERDADAAANLDQVLGDAEGSIQRLDDVARDLLGVRRAGIGQQDSELVAAESSDSVVRAERIAQTRSDLL